MLFPAFFGKTRIGCFRWNANGFGRVFACNVVATPLVSMLAHVGMFLGLSSIPVGFAFRRLTGGVPFVPGGAAVPLRAVAIRGDAARGQWLELAVHAGRRVRFPSCPLVPRP